MFTLVRALVYASLFIGVLLVFVPAQIVARSGIAAPPVWEPSSCWAFCSPPRAGVWP